jgi:CubicO group peptidase (beta-lactamase class C family)
MDARIDGEVAPGYEPVRDAFAAGASQLGEGGGAFAAYVAGRPVVDIWGGQARRGQPWGHDNTTVIMSSTKGLATVCAQILNDRGLLDVEAPVVEYWPEFGAAGKDRILVRHVLTHTCGVLGFGDRPPPVSWDGRGWSDYDTIASALAAAPARWAPGERFGYHAVTYGWLVGELVRRVSGVTIGTFFRSEVAEPLGLEAWIGTPPTEQWRVAQLHDHMMSGAPFPLRLLLRSARRTLQDPSTLAGQAFLAHEGSSLLDRVEALLSNPAVLEAELPFGNGTATARSLARLYSALAAGGEIDGNRILSTEAVKRFSVEAISMPDEILLRAAPPGTRWLASKPVRRTVGYLLNPAAPGEKGRFGPNPNSYGHDGAGGQIAFCDPDAGIAVGFIRSDLTSSGKLSTRLINVLYGCAAAESST